MKKKICIIITVCLLLGAVVCGCGQNKTAGGGSSVADPAQALIVGTWTQVTEDGSASLPDVGIPSGYVFRENGEGEDLFWNMTFTYTLNGDKIHISYDDSIGEDTDYRYTLEDGTLTMTRDGDPDAVPMIYQQKEAESEES